MSGADRSETVGGSSERWSGRRNRCVQMLPDAIAGIAEGEHTGCQQPADGDREDRPLTDPEERVRQQEGQYDGTELDAGPDCARHTESAVRAGAQVRDAACGHRRDDKDEAREAQSDVDGSMHG